jgi:hypothetical protein
LIAVLRGRKDEGEEVEAVVEPGIEYRVRGPTREARPQAAELG